MEKPNQEWIKENIDSIMRQFLKINPQFKKKDNVSRMAKSRHKGNMKRNMDTIVYRPYYYLAKHKQEEDRLFKIIKKTKEDRDLYKKHLNVWVSKYESAQKKMKDEFGEDSKEYKRVFR